MSKPNFAAMTRKELRAYILEHREDEEAFLIYMDKVTADPGEIYPAPQSIDDLKNFPELLENYQQNRREEA
jgi:pyridoxal/pyridoxine/pyridoxamine kinase